MDWMWSGGYSSCPPESGWYVTMELLLLCIFMNTFKKWFLCFPPASVTFTMIYCEWYLNSSVAKCARKMRKLCASYVGTFLELLGGAGESVCVECVCTLVQQNGNLYMHNQSCISLKYDTKNWQTTLHFPVSTRKHSHKISACHYYSCVSVVSLSAAQLSFISHHPLTEVAFPFRFSRRCIRIIKLYKTLSTKMAIDESDHHHLRVIYAHQAPTINPSSAQIVRT